MKKKFFFCLFSLIYSVQLSHAAPASDFSKKTDFLFSIDEQPADLTQINQTPAATQSQPASNARPTSTAAPSQPPTTTPPARTSGTASATPAANTPTPFPPQQAVPNIEQVISPDAVPSVENIETGALTTPGQATTPETPLEEEAATRAIEPQEKRILINFNNVGMIEYIRFISRISNKNFIFDENDLQFNVTIVSEEPTTIENIMTALLQELRIHDLMLLEQGNNLIIHKNPNVHAISRVLPSEANITAAGRADIVTKVFSLNTLEAARAADLIRPMVSAAALIEFVKDTNHLIVTDLVSNINQISQLIRNIDSPKSGQVIGQYVARNALVDVLVELTRKIMQPLANEQPLLLVPHNAINSIFIVSTPYLVERTIAVMQYLDKTEGLTQILNPTDLGNVPSRAGRGYWELDPNGNWIFQPEFMGVPSETPPSGNWIVDGEGNWYFKPGETSPTGASPEGRWARDANNNWIFLLTPGKTINAERLMRPANITNDLPVGHIERTKFYIHKLHYRNADKVVTALGKIATSLQQSGTSNAEVVSTINSAQGIEASNSLIFTGTPDALGKVKELVDELDIPVKQVLVEMLIIQTTLANSLNFSVNLASEFGGGRTAGGESFLTNPTANGTPPSILGIDFNQAVNPPLPPNIPTVKDIISPLGFNLGIIGQHVTMCGMRFNTLGALVNALHTDNRTDVLMTPKIVTEENVPAQVFVGRNIPYPIQSISNDLGNVITNNFDYRDVGTLLRVTPLIGDNDVITMQIEQELTNVITATSVLPGTNQVVVGPTTNKTKTTTKVHVPDGFFIIISGQILQETIKNRTQVPCLGSIPIIGAAFSSLGNQDNKNNLLIFIRPSIIETEDQIQNLTRHQQSIWDHSHHTKNPWKWEAEEAYDFLNLKPLIDTHAEWTWE